MRDRVIQQLRHAQALDGVGEVRPFTNQAICQHLGSLGAIDVGGALGIQRDLRQGDHAMRLALGVLNQRNDDLRKIIHSIGNS
jgi:hypothetical protein